MTREANGGGREKGAFASDSARVRPSFMLFVRMPIDGRSILLYFLPSSRSASQPNALPASF